MPTFTQNGTVEGEPANYSIGLPDSTYTIPDAFSPDSPQGVAFWVHNNGNVDSVVTFSNQTITGGTAYGDGWYAKVSNQDFNSGDTLEPGEALEIGVAVVADDPGIGNTANVTISVDIDHVQA